MLAEITLYMGGYPSLHPTRGDGQCIWSCRLHESISRKFIDSMILIAMFWFFDNQNYEKCVLFYSFIINDDCTVIISKMLNIHFFLGEVG